MSRPPRPHTSLTTTGAPVSRPGKMDYLPDEFADFVKLQSDLAVSEANIVTTGAKALRTITTRSPFFSVARVISVCVAARTMSGALIIKHNQAMVAVRSLFLINLRTFINQPYDSNRVNNSINPTPNPMASSCTSDLPNVDSLFSSGTKSDPAI